MTALLERGLSSSEIGVVVPYRAQSRLIRTLLRRKLGGGEVLNHLIIDTVERIQGQEREVVLVSFATSSPDFATQVSEFLFRSQRLNAAVTRPRTKLILIGSRQILDAGQTIGENREAVNILRSLIDSCSQFTLPGGRFE